MPDNIISLSTGSHTNTTLNPRVVLNFYCSLKNTRDALLYSRKNPLNSIRKVSESSGSEKRYQLFNFEISYVLEKYCDLIKG